MRHTKIGALTHTAANRRHGHRRTRHKILPAITYSSFEFMCAKWDTCGHGKIFRTYERARETATHRVGTHAHTDTRTVLQVRASVEACVPACSTGSRCFVSVPSNRPYLLHYTILQYAIEDTFIGHLKTNYWLRCCEVGIGRRELLRITLLAAIGSREDGRGTANHFSFLGHGAILITQRFAISLSNSYAIVRIVSLHEMTCFF